MAPTRRFMQFDRSDARQAKVCVVEIREGIKRSAYRSQCTKRFFLLAIKYPSQPGLNRSESSRLISFRCFSRPGMVSKLFIIVKCACDMSARRQFFGVIVGISEVVGPRDVAEFMRSSCCETKSSNEIDGSSSVALSHQVEYQLTVYIARRERSTLTSSSFASTSPSKDHPRLRRVLTAF
jgi:hypothetical protein